MPEAVEAQGPNVTFVGGRAIEQTESLGSNVEPDVRAEALEAVREAIKQAGESSAESAKSSKAKDPYKPAGTEPDRGPDGKFLPKSDPGDNVEPKTEGTNAESEPPDPAKASVKELLKAREKVAAAKREAKQANDALSQERQAFESQKSQLAQQMQQMQALQAQLQRQAQALQKFKQDPASAVREFGWEPEQFILDLAQ